MPKSFMIFWKTFLKNVHKNPTFHIGYNGKMYIGHVLQNKGDSNGQKNPKK